MISFTLKYRASWDSKHRAHTERRIIDRQRTGIRRQVTSSSVLIITIYDRPNSVKIFHSAEVSIVLDFVRLSVASNLTECVKKRKIIRSSYNSVSMCMGLVNLISNSYYFLY